jgi:hypothetical protein
MILQNQTFLHYYVIEKEESEKEELLVHYDKHNG